jgi:lipoprotein-anchoring transpeptidase ErfK/SrfK
MRRGRSLGAALLGAATLAGAAAAPAAGEATIVSNERGHSFWSRIDRDVAVRAAPSRRSRRVGVARATTYYGFADVVVRLRERGPWTKVRYSGLGRRVGWVPTAALGERRFTSTWVVIDRARKRLRAYRGKRRVLTARVGIGARGSPTPGGRFFIRERLVPANKRGIYGPIALGLSAYSKYRTDWPGGGQVGIHGTNQPRLIPGRISNGCVRLHNRDIRRLDRLIGRGTPVHVR